MSETLVTVGEFSLHKILEFLREINYEDSENPWDDLLNLMKTCRVMYIAVCNLPRHRLRFGTPVPYVGKLRVNSVRMINVLSGIRYKVLDFREFMDKFPRMYDIPIDVDYGNMKPEFKSELLKYRDVKIHSHGRIPTFPDAYRIEWVNYRNHGSNLLMFQHIKHVNLSSHRFITDVSALNGVHSLNLNFCSSLLDISSLDNIQELSIISTQVSDVSNCKNTLVLLADHTNISDVNCLPQLKRLSARDTWVKSVNKLVNVEELNVIDTLVNDFGNLHMLRDLKSSLITEAPPNLKKLFLEKTNIDQTVDFTRLVMPNLHTVNIQDFDVNTLANLSHVHTLILVDCCNVVSETIRDLGNLSRLKIVGSGIERIPDSLKNLQTLELTRCYMLTDICSLTGAKAVDIRCCQQLRRVDGLKNCKEVSLYGLDKVTDISPLKDVEKLSLSHLPNITNLHTVSHLLHLKLATLSQLLEHNLT